MKIIRKKPIVSHVTTTDTSQPFKRVPPETVRRNIDNIGEKGEFDTYIKREYTLYKIKDGEPNFIRILPPSSKSPDSDFVKRIPVHSYMNVDGGYVCKKKYLDEPDPICDVHIEARISGDEKRAKITAPKFRYLFQILDVSDKPQSDGMLVLDAPQTLRDMIFKSCQDPRTGEAIDLSDFETGREIIFYREKKKEEKYPKYLNVQLGQEVELSAEHAAMFVPFDDLIYVPTEEELEEVAKYIRTAPLERVVRQESPVTPQSVGSESGVGRRKLVIKRKV
jgi:hypothetical protein